MIPIATADTISIYCPDEGRFSFFNSPYPSHKAKTGIDIYPKLRFNDIAPSPICGEIFFVKKVKTPSGRGFRDAGYDFLTLIKSHENPNKVVKVLHVEPIVKVGDKINEGDAIGRLLRSGYFSWGTSPHIHLEIRDPNDPIRARGGSSIKNLIVPKESKSLEHLEGNVIELVPEYALLKLNECGNGLTCEVDGNIGLLDGGIPYYGWMGVHTKNPKYGKVNFLGREIAIVRKIGNEYMLAKCQEFKFTVNNVTILGLSLYLTPKNTPIFKILPFRGKKLDLHIGDRVNVKIKK
jgi:hypothetical protein